MPEYCVTKDVKEVEDALENGQKVKAVNNLGSPFEIEMGDDHIRWCHGGPLGTKHEREFRIYPKPPKEYTFFEALELAKKNRGMMFVNVERPRNQEYGFMFKGDEGVPSLLSDLRGDRFQVDSNDLTVKFVKIIEEI